MNKLKHLVAILGISLISSSCFSQAVEIEKEILALMEQQEISWNQGDIEGFMSVYWKSDSLLFVGSNGPSYGWQTTLDNYRKNYQNKALMGKLDFTKISFENFSDSSAMLSGKWELQRESGDIGGYFSLIWKRIDQQWKIVYDHTSLVKAKQ